MKTRLFSILTATALTLFMAACANSDDMAQKDDKQKGGTETTTDGLTAFVVEDNTATTRTTASHDGSGLNFYWTEGDRLWVKNDAESPALKQDARSDIADKLTASTIPGGVQRADKAKFWFDGTYTNSTYPVRYTGKNSTSGDKVTIKAEQIQPAPNDASHLGESGDCGTAVATKVGGRYHFTLDHKAAYLTLMPYNSPQQINTLLTQIKVTADKAICGEFDFDDSGINLSSRPTPTPANQSITLKLKDADPHQGFAAIPQALTPATNAATIVLAPGTYSTLTVEYTFHNICNKDITISKTYNDVVLTAGKNKSVKADLNIPAFRYPTDYIFGDNPATNYYPNMNEISWYTMHGDIHWDDSKLFTVNGILYQGGAWIKKLSVIAADHSKPVSALVATACNGVSYSIYNYKGFGQYVRFDGPAPIMGEPANTNDYFFIYALGQNGHYASIGELIELFSSTGNHLNSYNPYPSGSIDHRYMLVISKAYVASLNADIEYYINKWPDER
uniref:Fimbrillin family protein n=1 Tax=Prevotella sp. GTC17253 TaxID=3236793 RepID=A0AB33IMT1_9BACT